MRKYFPSSFKGKKRKIIIIQLGNIFSVGYITFIYFSKVISQI